MQVQIFARRKRMHLFLIILLLVSAGYFYFVLWPLRQNCIAAKQQLQLWQRKIQQDVQLVKRIPILRQEKQGVQTEWKGMQASLLEEDDWAQIILELEDGAEMNGVILESILPEKNKKKGIYCIIPFELQVSGTYRAITDYLRFLESMPWLLNYETLSAKQDEQTTTTEIRIMTYCRRDV